MRKILLYAALLATSGLAAESAGAADIAVSAQDPAVTAVETTVLPLAGGVERPWSYTGANGSARWGDLDPGFSLCASGMRQSPVNIATFYQEDVPALETDYRPVPLTVANAGNIMRVGHAPGSGFSVDGFRYDLRRIEFHTPSEHYMDGASWPMEIQFIHQGGDGSLAIIAALVKAGKQNPTFEAILQNLPAKAGTVRKIDSVSLLASALMPDSLDYYTYDGSLTSPPCTEGVRWFVLKDTTEISEGQLKALQTRFPFNARPVQPLNDRAVKGR